MQQPRREAPQSVPRSVPSRCGPECRTQHDIVYPPGIHIHPAAHRWRACSPYGGHHTRRECQWPAPAGAGSLESGRVSGRAVPLVGPSAGPRVVFRSFIDFVNHVLTTGHAYGRLPRSNGPSSLMISRGAAAALEVRWAYPQTLQPVMHRAMVPRPWHAVAGVVAYGGKSLSASPALPTGSTPNSSRCSPTATS